MQYQIKWHNVLHEYTSKKYYTDFFSSLTCVPDRFALRGGHPSFIPVHDTWYINLFGYDFWNYS